MHGQRLLGKSEVVMLALIHGRGVPVTLGWSAVLSVFSLQGCSSPAPDSPDAECEIVDGNCPEGCRAITGLLIREEMHCVEGEHILLGCSRMTAPEECFLESGGCVRAKNGERFEVDLCDPPWPDSLRARFSDCEELGAVPENRCTTRAVEYERIEQAARVIQRMDVHGPCSSRDDCAYLPLGATACEVAQRYVIHSKSSPNQAQLRQLAEDLERMETEFNQTYAVDSSCSPSAAPGFDCYDGTCDSRE